MNWIVIVYVLIIVLAFMPTVLTQRKRKKEHQELMNGLTIGDQVSTIGGLQGTLVKINEDSNTVEIQVDKGIRLTYLKSSIASRRKQQGE